MTHSTSDRSTRRFTRRHGVGAGNPPARLHRLARALAACALLSGGLGGAALHAQVLPSGMNTVAGQASASTRGGVLTVTNSPNAIIQWDSFSIGAGNGVRFEQAGASSQVLNRVVGRDPSSILGSLSSNGRVWLLNPNGVLFGQGARVDVAGLVVSTLNLNDHDWLSGRARFTLDPGSAGGIVNQGELRSSMGGHVALIGAAVRNEGDIQAPGGQVLLAAGRDVELLDSATPNVRVRLHASGGGVDNLGRLQADGGRIDVHGASVNQSGIVRADSLSSGPGGEVVLQATGRLTLDGDSRTSAVAAQGQGGRVQLLGREVALLDRAQVDASGSQGGGVVLAGGGREGRDPSVPNAQGLYFGRDAAISADATARGDGGSIVLWSDHATRAYGGLSARGGPSGGNGGFIETSGGWLDARPARLGLGAPHGAPGQWLLDPFNITISDTGPDAGFDASFTATASGSTITTGTIKAQLDAGVAVTVSTGGSAGSEPGHISMNNATLSINSGFSPAGALTLLADGNITLSGSTINNSGEGANITLQAGRSGGTGSVSLVNSSITSAGGDIFLGGFGSVTSPSGGTFTSAAFSSSGPGVTLNNSSLNSDAGLTSGGAGNGTVTLAGSSTATGAAGVLLTGGSVIQAGVLNIYGSSTRSQGVDVAAASLTGTRGIDLQGVGAQAGVNHRAGSSMVSSPGGASSLLSVSGRSTGSANGVIVAGTLTADGGDSVEVSAGNSGGANPALLVTGDTSVTGNGGTLTLRTLSSGASNDIVIDGADLSALNPGVVISGARSLTLNDTTIVGRTVQLRADNITLNGATSISGTSISAVDVIVLSNRNGTGGLTSFNNNSTVGAGGSGALQGSPPDTRWIIWASDVTSSAFDPGSLPYDFTLHGASSSADWGSLVGNGFVSSAPSVATVTGTVSPKVYDATLAATVVGPLSATGPRGEVVDFSIEPGVRFVTKDVGTAKPTELFGNASFTFADSLGRPVHGMTLTSGITGDVTPATIHVTGVTANDKIYDATATATLSGTPTVTPLGGDRLRVVGTPIATFSTKNAGEEINVAVSGYTLGGPAAGNYILQQPNGLFANIFPAPLAVTGLVPNNKVYDGTVSATASGSATVVPLGSDDVTLLGAPTLQFVDRNAGVGKKVLVSGFHLGGDDGGNYELSGTLSGTANITPLRLAITGLTASDKVYDATVTAAVTGRASVSPLANDSVSVVGTPLGRFDDKNVGTGKPVTVTGLRLSGTDAGNYSLGQQAGLAASITPATLQLNGLTVPDKVYDGTRTAELSFTGSLGALGTDDVALGGATSALFADKNVGTGKTVQVTGLTLTGADAANYLLPAALTASGNITPAPLVVTGLVANNKVYDATTTATTSGRATVAALGQDVVTVGGTPVARFDDKNVGTGKTVQVSGLSLGGADAGNYLLSGTLSATADITPAPLALGGLTADNKIYDATRAATLSGSATVAPLAGDTVAVGGTAVGQFDDKNVGTGKAVTVTGLTLSGRDAANYTLTQAAPLTADITAATLQLTGLSIGSKVYDGTLLAPIAGTASVAAFGNDVVFLGGAASALFADKNVGTAKTVQVAGLTLSGADAGNYRVADTLTATGDITPAPLVVGGLGAANKVYDATRSATASGTPTVTPLGSDVVAVGGTPTVQFADKNAGAGKALQVTGLTLSGADAGNYSIAPVLAATADITRATLVVGGLVAGSKVYDATRDATVSGAPSVTPLPGDVVGVGGTVRAQFADKNVGRDKAVTVTGVTLTGADAGNYTAVAASSLLADITPAPLQLGGLTADSKVYDATRNATVSGVATVTPLRGDSVGVGGTPLALFDDKDVGTGKTVQISGLTLTGPDAGNYTTTGTLTRSADITPATLSYVARPVSAEVRTALPPLTGSVSGFVGGESQATATTGTLVFTTPATPESEAGSYPVLGSGLSAGNYRFVQDPANSRALTLRPGSGPAEVLATTRNTDGAPRQQLELTLRPARPNDPMQGGVIDLVPAPPGGGTPPPPAGGSGTGQPLTAVAPSTPESIAALSARLSTFEPVPLASMSPEAVSGVLAARAEHKRAVLADALKKLEADPTLADMPPCRSRDELLAGGCVMTEALKRVLKADPQSIRTALGVPPATAAPAVPATSAAAAAPVAAPPAAPPAPVTATPPVAGPAAPPAAAPAAPVVAAAPPAVAAPAAAAAAAPTAAQARAAAAAARTAALRASSARRVVTASLPQIQRKVALVVGVDRYDDPAIPTLTNAVGDARAIAQLLETQMGYETVVLENATRNAVIAALNLLAVELSPRDSVVLYYAGHGEVVETTKLGYWMLADSQAKRPETWLSNTDIARMVAQIDASQVALISDSCYSGSLVSDQRIRAAVGGIDPVQVLASKSVVVMSSGGNEPVADEGKQGHSPFAWNLMNNLRRLPDWQPGGNVFERVRFAVARELPQRPQYGAFKAGGHQGSGDYLFENRRLGAAGSN